MFKDISNMAKGMAAWMHSVYLGIKQSLKGNMRTIYPLMLGGAIIAIFYFTFEQQKNGGNRIKASLASRDSLIRASMMANVTSLDKSEKLKSTFMILDKVKEPYLHIAYVYVSYSNTYGLLFPICSILTAIMGFLIAKKGWDSDSSYYLKASFLVCFFFSSLFGVLPQVYKNNDNLKKNLQKYYTFSSMQMEVLDIVQSGDKYSAGKRDTLISEMNGRIISNQDLFFDVDLEKVSVDIQKQLGGQ